MYSAQNKISVKIDDRLTDHALLNKAVLASLNVPEADKMTPRYLYLFTHSRFLVSILKLWLITLPVLLKTIPAMLKKNLELYDLFKDWEYEKHNLKFCKYLLEVNKRSTNIAVLSELGRMPLFISHITAKAFSLTLLG
jgi:hypothetical protein